MIHLKNSVKFTDDLEEFPSTSSSLGSFLNEKGDTGDFGSGSGGKTFNISRRNTFTTTQKDKQLQLNEEIHTLKNEITQLKSNNHQLNHKAYSLEKQIDHLQGNITNTNLKNIPVTKIEHSFDKIDTKFFEINKILQDLSKSKALLQRTNYTTTTSCHTDLRKSKSMSQSDYNLNHLNDSHSVCSNHHHQGFKYNPIKDKLNSTYDIENGTSNHYRHQSKLHLRTENGSFREVNKSVDLFGNLKSDLERATNDNLRLTKKLFEIQKSFSKNEQKSELWKTLFNRVANYLPENELNLVKSSTEIEKLNMLTDDLDEANTPEAHKNSLKSTITQLNDNNFNLKIQLERLKSSNRNELENLSRYESEDKKQLLQEISHMRAQHTHELALQAKIQTELKNEIEHLRQRLKMEHNQKEELKHKFKTEFNAVKVRFENEITKQNKLMQEKYEELNNEIRRLNDVIRQLKCEKVELKQVVEKRNMFVTESFEQNSSYLSKNDDSVYSTVRESCELNFSRSNENDSNENTARNSISYNEKLNNSMKQPEQPPLANLPIKYVSSCFLSAENLKSIYELK